jgi:lysophospholipase L1-like esterase
MAGAAVVLVRQNPEYTGSLSTVFTIARQNQHQSGVASFAARQGAGVIDIFQAFLDAGDFSAYISSDGIHPSTAGYAFAATVAAATFGI